MPATVNEDDRKRMPRIQQLDALRGIAAVLVLIFHLSIWRLPESMGYGVGSLGVHLFFMISGFVILMTVERSHNLRDFAVSRISRLYPAYWLVVVITFLAKMAVNLKDQIPLTTDATPLQLLANLTMFQQWLGMPDLDGQYWTLFVEMQFYLLMALVLITRTLKWIRVCSLVLSVLCIILVHWCGPEHRLFQLFPLMKYFPLFNSGMLLLQIHRGNRQLATFLLLTLSTACALDLYRPEWYIYVTRIQYSITILIFHILFLVVSLGFDFIANRVTLFLGRISYSLYLVHHFIFASFLCSYLIVDLRWATIPAMLTAGSAAIVAATAICLFAEEPWSRKMKNKLRSYASRGFTVKA